ncbi:hypothetical protein SE15_00205 [Thermanaerothrix daxensis]|uniref:RNA polymerase subunit sigma-24 n=1 Tax=Thermanaerothrix daxensis TaxID=869279 RepID=A0A0P6Y3S8_9CHLR|nr:RNA polymerase sigma factor [Thermanaerothrix daxensis]KPL83736.1 hypothetical protein SE15_00205 [Thermanaerothrix daxensis]
MEENEAIQRLKQGDISGLEYLVRQYQTKAIRSAYLIVRDVNLAEDIVEEAFLQVYRCIHQFNAQRAFEPWFMKIVLNMSRRAAHNRKRYCSLEDESNEERRVHNPPEFKRPEESLEYTELLNALWQALGALTPEQRTALVQRYYLNLSEAEIASHWGIALGTLKWRLHIARKRLRQFLQREEINPE